MGVPKRLTEMQRKFAEILVFGDAEGRPVTKTEAAKLAGFSPNRSSQEGYELTNPKMHPLVVDYIGKLREEKLQKYMVTFDGHIAELHRGS
jgi:phage terminase small subunit